MPMLNPILTPSDAPWKPVYETLPLQYKNSFGELRFNHRTRGEDVAIFAETFLVAIDGFRAGQPLVLAKWQRNVINAICEEGPDGFLRYRNFLVMIPRKNGKTFIAALLVLYHLMFAPDFAEIYSAAKDRKQAKMVMRMVLAWIDKSPSLKKTLHHVKSDNTVINKKTGSFYTALSSDAGGVHGANPYFVIADEVHAWEAMHSSKRAREFWGALSSGGAARPESQVVVISTAGDNIDDSLLGDIYKEAVAVATGKSDSISTGCKIWQAEKSDDPLLPATWMKANPNLAEGLLSLPYIEHQLKTFAATNITNFLKLHLNIWSRIAGDTYINEFHWAKAEVEGIPEDQEIPLGRPVTVGFDGSQTGDSTAIVIQDVQSGIIKTFKLWEKPEDGGEWFVDPEEVEDAFIDLHNQYDVLKIWADKTYFTGQIIRWNDKHEWGIEDIPQTDARMIPMGNLFRSDIATKKVFHTGDQVMTKYVMNAIETVKGAYAKESRASRNRIDVLVGAVLANGARHFLFDVEDSDTEVLVLR